MSTIRRSTAAGAGCAVLALIVATAAWAGAPQQSQVHVEEQPQHDNEFVFFGPHDGPSTFTFEHQGGDFEFAPFSENAFFGPELEGFWQDEVIIDRLRDMERALAQEGRIRVSPRGLLRARSSSAVGRVLAHAEEIGLTDDQQDQIRDMQRAVRREQIRRDADLEIAEMDLEEMMDDDNAGLDAIEQKMREIANLGVDARMESLRMERDVMAILTAEQRDKLDELMPERVIYESILRQRQR